MRKTETRIAAFVALGFGLAGCAETQNRPYIAPEPLIANDVFEGEVISRFQIAASRVPPSFVDEFQRRSAAEAARILRESQEYWEERGYDWWEDPGLAVPPTPPMMPGLPEFTYQCTLDTIADIASFTRYHQVNPDAMRSNGAAIDVAFSRVLAPMLDITFIGRLESNARILGIDDHPALECMRDLVTDLHFSEEEGSLPDLISYDRLGIILIATHNMAVLRDVAFTRAEGRPGEMERVPTIMDDYLFRFHVQAHRNLPLSLQDKTVLDLLLRRPLLDADSPRIGIVDPGVRAEAIRPSLPRHVPA